MRGDDYQKSHVFSYLSLEVRIRKDHLVRAIRAMVDVVLAQLSRRFDGMYAKMGTVDPAVEAVASPVVANIVFDCCLISSSAMRQRFRVDRQTSPLKRSSATIATENQS